MSQDLPSNVDRSDGATRASTQGTGGVRGSGSSAEIHGLRWWEFVVPAGVFLASYWSGYDSGLIPLPHFPFSMGVHLFAILGSVAILDALACVSRPTSIWRLLVLRVLFGVVFLTSIRYFQYSAPLARRFWSDAFIFRVEFVSYLLAVSCNSAAWALCGRTPHWFRSVLVSVSAIWVNQFAFPYFGELL